MKILVCVKQVPDTSGKIAVNPDGTLNRASMQTIINPDDMNAVEAALKLKDETGCPVYAVTMGPMPAESMLRELMAMGCDGSYLISGREFGGSDTYATSQILAAQPLFGKHTLDDVLRGDTGMVGSRHPQGALSAHAPVPDEDVLQGIVQGVAHVQDTGDVGRWHDNREGLLRIGRLEGPLLFPGLVNT